MSISVIPHPASLDRRPGEFALAPGTTIGARGEAVQPGWLLHDALIGTGLRLPVVDPEDSTASIRLEIDPDSGDHPEAYRLTVTPRAVHLVAAHADGLARAIQTVRQLLPPRALGQAQAGGLVSLPCCEIADAPRFSWRGVHLDVARHFMPKPSILQMIDAIALHRMNVLHLHLTDDQGWRLDVPSQPRLTEVGAWRSETVIGPHGAPQKSYDGTPHGGFYSADDLREIVAYAAERRITVVPEVDLPGHVSAVLAAYPELGGRGGTVEVARHFGVFHDVLAPTDAAVAFARDVLDVVVDIFPSRYVHIGGDECPRTQWQEDGRSHRRAAALGLASVDELQGWFMRELARHLALHDRRVIGWDEIADDGSMPPDTTVMAWRGVENARRALQKGHDVVMAPHQFTYFDKYQSSDSAEPLAQPGIVTLQDVLDFDPAPADMPDPGQVLGIQGQLWSEYMPTPRALQYMAFPRVCALAEVAWAAPGAISSDEFAGRLSAHLPRLDAMGLEYRPLDGPRPWQQGGTGRRRGHR